MAVELRIGTPPHQYRLDTEIGSGGFGVVYEGTDLNTGKKIAVKMEEREAQKTSKLEKEYDLYQKLRGGEGFINVSWFEVGEYYNILVMDLLGPSLGALFNHSGKRFSLKTVLMLVDQLLDRLEYIHSKGIVYRDVKPNNFVLGGREGSEILYVVDFGLAQMYVDEHNRHLPFEQQNFAGTAHYASLNAHLKRAQSRRDDLESLGFLLIYFLEGSLPWQGLKAASKRERRKLIGTMKLKTTIKELCKGHPEEFERYFDYVRSLDFADRPDYHFLRTIFRNLFRAKGYKYDYKYDWTLKRESYTLPFISPKIMVIPTKKYQRRSVDRMRHMQRVRGLQEEAERKRYERLEQERAVSAKPKNPPSVPKNHSDKNLGHKKDKKRSIFFSKRGKK